MFSKTSPKKWPFFKELAARIKNDFKNKYPVLLAPAHQKLRRLKLNCKIVLDDNKAVDIKTLISLISKAKFIISNDTGPAHIASHLDKNCTIWQSHNCKKVSIESFNFKPISVKDLKVCHRNCLNQIRSKLN